MSLSNEEKVKIVLEKLKSTEKDVVRIEATEGTTNLTESKFGGLPYLPITATVPQDVRGGNLYMIAQFNLSELPANSFPISTGILQFWIANDDGFGIDHDNFIGQKHTRVVYYKAIETCFSEEELMTQYVPLAEGEYFPVTSSYKLNFEKDKEIISTSDFSFDNKFVTEWNTLYPDDEIEEYWDVDVEDIDELFSDIKGFGHKLLGYPYMYHDDRDGGIKHHDYVLLFQMDSDDSLDNPIKWGDCGLCHFFIKEEDLKNCDFSKVLYSWGCS